MKEASIPVTEKVYCPYPKCSALMSKLQVLEYSKSTVVGAERSGIRKCAKCQGVFCINCKVPWHYNTNCLDYKRRNPYPPAEDARMKTLADGNLWRQCVKCNHMIELAAGCYHMTCRCGYEFCYTCGAEWKNKKATCSCLLWEDGNILYNEDDSDEEDNHDDFYD
ncbi:zinc finger (C3HC4-type RING finger) family protein [Actinidia rufa]|uniref:RBR-type E3 ubiquitin transferase n=1 Tax=Actinidia rufa TaxID=165716 RepID=A0A7J0DMU7_9ERIC|nr:zinc finger (C3HC4-type RING finger) family protein [Actinidia rufa]